METPHTTDGALQLPSATPKENPRKDEYAYLVRTAFIDGRPMIVLDHMKGMRCFAVFENSELGAEQADEMCERFNKGRVRL